MWSISHVARTISQTASHLGEGHVLQYCLLLHLASTKRQACISPHRSRLSCKKVGVRVWVSDILSSEPSLEWECGSARLSCIHHIHKLKNEKFSKERRGSPEVKIYAKCDSAYDCVSFCKGTCIWRNIYRTHSNTFASVKFLPALLTHVTAVQADFEVQRCWCKRCHSN